jgi:hypothetical protein
MGENGAHHFNLLQKTLRHENSGDLELFKNHMDIFLAMFPNTQLVWPGIQNLFVLQHSGF